MAKASAKTIQVHVMFDPPPIPFRGDDWQAWVDGREEDGVSTGPTAINALEALVEKLEVSERQIRVIS